MYTYDGFSLVLESPSPKFQSHVVGDPVDASSNCTVRGAVPDVGDAENKATSGVAVVAVVVGVAVVTVVVGTTVVVVVVGVAVVTVVVGTTVVAVVVGVAVVTVVVGTTVVAVVVGVAVGVAVVFPPAATGITTQAIQTSVRHPMRRMKRVFTGHHRQFPLLPCVP